MLGWLWSGDGSARPLPLSAEEYTDCEACEASCGSMIANTTPERVSDNAMPLGAAGERDDFNTGGFQTESKILFPLRLPLCARPVANNAFPVNFINQSCKVFFIQCIATLR